MSERTDHLVQRMREEGEKTLAFFQSLPPDKWRTPVYADGTVWTIHEVLCHFVDAERSLRWVVADVLSGGAGAPEGIDINVYNAEHVAELVPWGPAALIDAFITARQATIALLQNVSDSDLDRVGRHPVLGLKSVEDLIKIMYLHLKGHQRDMQRALDRTSQRSSGG